MIDWARSAVRKSPSTNFPVSSMKKQRSASPSQAIPSSAPSDRTFFTMNVRFSGSSGFGSWSGNSPSGSQYVVTCSIGSWSSSGPTIGPAIPFPPSSTTLRAFTSDGSMNLIAARRNSSPMSSSDCEHPRDGASDPVGVLTVELLAVHAADVVGLEDGRVHAARHSSEASTVREMQERRLRLLSVVVPLRDEEGTVGELYRRVDAALVD